MTKRTFARGLLVLLVLVAVGCGSSGNSTDSAAFSNDPSGRPGSPEVYSRIETMTNCTRLQREFDVAAGNADRLHATGGTAPVPLSYMDAADNRMHEVGCYG